jgi:hypothetical protein
VKRSCVIALAASVQVQRLTRAGKSVSQHRPRIGKRVRQAIGNSRAQAAFEFMLVLPIFIPVVLLTVDFGAMMYEYVSVSNASREGARYAAVNCETGTCTVADVQQRTADRSGGIVSDAAEVTVGWRDVNGHSVDGSTGKGDSVVVKVDHPYDFLFFPFTINVSSCADYRLEQQDSGSSLPTGTSC